MLTLKHVIVYNLNIFFFSFLSFSFFFMFQCEESSASFFWRFLAHSIAKTHFKFEYQRIHFKWFQNIPSIFCVMISIIWLIRRSFILKSFDVIFRFGGVKKADLNVFTYILYWLRKRSGKWMFNYECILSVVQSHFTLHECR